VKLLRGDLALGLLSLGLAASLWFVIAGRQTSERGLAVAVELRNFPRDLELTGGAADSVAVRVRASPGLIDSLDPARVLATIDLAGAQEGEKIVQLTPDQVRVPFGFKVVKITPSLLRLQLEGTLRKGVPVRPRIVGRPAAGFELVQVSSEPAEVRIAGPRSRVEDLREAFTEPVSVDAASAAVQATVGVGLADPLVRLEGTSRVFVTARVRESPETRTFEGLEVVAHGRAVSIEPARAAVVVSGPASQIRALGASALQPYVTIPAKGALPLRLRVAVEIGSGHPGVTVVETRPAEVSVRPAQRPRAAPPR
jgi:hypothetical protein